MTSGNRGTSTPPGGTVGGVLSMREPASPAHTRQIPGSHHPSREVVWFRWSRGVVRLKRGGVREARNSAPTEA